MFQLTDRPEAKAYTLEELKKLTDNSIERKADWQEVDENEQIIAEGGICLDSECTCRGTWIHWRS